MESMHQPIIPGLPDDLGIRCLAMLSHGYHGVMETVSKRWRDVIRSEEYANCKAREGWCGDWLFVITNRRPYMAYDPEADRWHPLPPPPSPHRRLKPCSSYEMDGCHCAYNKFLFIRSIYRRLSRPSLKHNPFRLPLRLLKPIFIANEMFQFDPFKKEWSTVRSMWTSRSDFASCTMDGKIYVAGGRNSDYRQGMNVAEVYDPLTDKWEYLPPMPVPMWSCRGIAYKGKFHVIYAFEDDQGLHQIQVFDPLSRSWRVKHENWSPSVEEVAVADDQVYSMNESGTLERRDAEKDDWHFVGAVPPQLHGAHGYKLASLGHELYVMGGQAFRRDDLRLVKVLVYFDQVRVCDPRCLPLIWREARPMWLNASDSIIIGWASLKQK